MLLLGDNSRTLTATQFYNSFSDTSFSDWVTGFAYSANDIVLSNNKKYLTISGGTSGAIQPTHNSGSISDGGVDWLFIENVGNAGSFKNNLYFCISKSDAWRSLVGLPVWADSTTYQVNDLVDSGGSSYICLFDHTADGAGNNEPSVDGINWSIATVDSPPDTAILTDANESGFLNDIVTAKRLNGNDASLSMPNVSWTSGTVYTPFQNDDEVFDYVINSSDQIYKCIDNKNGSQSLSEPTGESLTYTFTGDGYVWKYLATISASDAQKFKTSNFFPIQFLNNDDGSTQFDVQQAARISSISRIVVTDGGTTGTTANVIISAPDDLVNGIQATGTAIFDSGVMTHIEVTNIGAGYITAPTISFSGYDGTGTPTATAHLAPIKGHGHNILLELNARHMIISAQFNDTEGGYAPTDISFRRSMIIIDPVDVNDLDSFKSHYIGVAHALYSGDETSGLNELKALSGSIVMVENVEPVTRSPSQIEDIKFVIGF